MSDPLTAVKTVETRLFSLQDLTYRDFVRSLLPTVDPDTVIGIRTPALRALAKEISGTPEAAGFLSVLPHRYYEENNLHAFLIEQMRDYDEVTAALDRFLPFVDNWATCDSMHPKVLKKHLPEMLVQIRSWIASEQTYTVRYAVGLLMNDYLDAAFSPEYPAMVAAVRSGEYYVNMMRAWYFATALAKQYDAVLPYLAENRLDLWTHNKAIQKAVESYRITDEQKAMLRGMRRKKAE